MEGVKGTEEWGGVAARANEKGPVYTGVFL